MLTVPCLETETAEIPLAFTIRRAVPADAARLLAFAGPVFNEPEGKLMIAPGEFQRTVEEQREFIRSHEAEGNLLIAAFAGEECIGLLSFQCGSRIRNRHCGEFGMCVAREARGRGVGTALLERLIAWARASSQIHRVELGVFANNPGAIRLYERLGFEVEGVRRGAANLEGEKVDVILMAISTE